MTKHGHQSVSSLHSSHEEHLFTADAASSVSHVKNTQPRDRGSAFGGQQDYVMAPRSSPARLDSVSCSRTSPKSCFKANQHLTSYLTLFIHTRACNQSNDFKATLQTNTCSNAVLSTILQRFSNNHDWLLLCPFSELVLYKPDRFWFFFPLCISSGIDGFLW